MTDKVKLTTMDGETVEVDVEIACKSILVKGIVDDSGIEDEIPLASVKKTILDKIIEFCEHIDKNSPPEIDKPLRSASIADVVSPWLANYTDLPQAELFDLILAANYLDVKSLLELSTAKVASIIKNKSIQTYFHK